MILETRGTSYAIPVDIPDLQFFHSASSFHLETGEQLHDLTIAYHTYGQMNARKDNVIWVFHALTANSHVTDWWAGLFGEGALFDPSKQFIVCANILGSCYGSTCARSINPLTNEAYGLDFPLVTIRDIVRAHDLLRAHLGIEQIALGVGGSCGGHQALEYAAIFPERMEKMALLVTSARESAWAIAIHEAGRMSLQADPSFWDNTDEAGEEGLRGARAVGLLGYRTYDAYIETQTDSDQEKLKDFRASSYIQYQ
ncbi:MAG: alpha/beta fold hydrolase [Bacteroidota bacterium]